MQRIPVLLLLFVFFAATAIAQRGRPRGRDSERRRGPFRDADNTQGNPDMKPMFGRGQGNRGGPRGIQTGGRRFDGPRFDGRGDEFPTEVNDGPESRPMGFRRDQDRPQRFGPGGRRPNGRRNEMEEADHDHDNEGPDGDEAGNFTGPFGFRPFGGRPFGRRPFGRRNDTEDGDNDFNGEERPFRPRPFGGRRHFGRRNDSEDGDSDFNGEERPFRPRPFGGRRPFGRRNDTEDGDNDFHGGERPFRPRPFSGRRPFSRRNGTEGRGDGFRGDRLGKPHFGRRNETDVDGQRPFKRSGGRGTFGGRGDVPFKGRSNTEDEVDVTTPVEQPAEPLIEDTNAIDGGNVVF